MRTETRWRVEYRGTRWTTRAVEVPVSRVREGREDAGYSYEKALAIAKRLNADLHVRAKGE
jgi:hypothetical protein